MMTAAERSELERYVNVQIEKKLNVVLRGNCARATTTTESIENLFPGMPTIEARPLVEPFGFHGIAPDGTVNYTARVGSHYGGRVVFGHLDSRRPALRTGESAIYSVAGYVVSAGNGALTVSKGGVSETMVVGDTLLGFLSALISLIATHSHPALGAPPAQAAQFIALGTSFLDNGKILAKDGGRFE